MNSARRRLSALISGGTACVWFTVLCGSLLGQPRAVTDDEPVEWDVPANTPATNDGGATINPTLLEHVRDNTLGIAYEDRPAYFYTLWLCQQVPAQTLREFALAYRDRRQARDPNYAQQPKSKFPQFADIFKHPEEYRGRPVTLQGHFRKLIQYDAGENDLGIGDVYEGWIYTADSRGNPAVVVFTEKPESLPLGADINEEVRITGYFLKMYGYDAQDTTRRAPLLMAGTVEWFPLLPTAAGLPIPTWVYALITALAIILVWGLWQKSESPRLASRFHSGGRNFDDFPPQEFLGDIDGRPVEPHH